MAFLETPQFPVDISYGSKGGPTYNTSIVRTLSGTEKRVANWTYPLHTYDVSYGVKVASQVYTLLQFFHSVQGRANAFRFKDWKDFRSGDTQTAPSSTDQQIGTGNGATLTFQLQKTYVSGALSQVRLIKKPVTSTTLVSISNKTDQRWTVNTTTGIVTFSANVTKSITAITKASLAQITFSAAHGLVQGDTFRITGVGGMTEINSQRATIVNVVDSTNVQVDINSSGYSTYTSGGTVNTIPQSGEIVRAGFEFDVPCRFDDDMLDVTIEDFDINSTQIRITEIRL